MPTETVDQRHLDQPVAGADIRSVMANHRTTSSRAIGTSFVAPKKPTMSRSERVPGEPDPGDRVFLCLLTGVARTAYNQ